MTRSADAQRKVEAFKERPLRPGDPALDPSGTLIIIGGREDRENGRLILRRVAQLLGDDGKLVVATLATESPDESFAEYERAFRGLGVRHVHHLGMTRRTEGDSAKVMRVLEDATGVFFTGGDQLRITSVLGDTAAFSRIYEIFLEGGVIAGTSAGAAIMSDTMLVAGGQDGSHRIDENLRLAPGLAFIKDMVIDQHFAERGRINRLLAVIGQNPRVLGVGIDENTAIEVVRQTSFRVLGAGGVTVLDGKSVSHTNVAEEEADRTLSLFGATLHLLSQGDSFDLRTREPKIGSARLVDEEIGGDGPAEIEAEAAHR